MCLIIIDYLMVLFSKIESWNVLILENKVSMMRQILFVIITFVDIWSVQITLNPFDIAQYSDPSKIYFCTVIFFLTLHDFCNHITKLFVLSCIIIMFYAFLTIQCFFTFRILKLDVHRGAYTLVNLAALKDEWISNKIFLIRLKNLTLLTTHPFISFCYLFLLKIKFFFFMKTFI